MKCQPHNLAASWAKSHVLMASGHAHA